MTKQPSSASTNPADTELETLKKLNQTLKDEKRALERENKALKRLVSSKRFRAATRVAETYNHLFPLGTGRRRDITSTASKIISSRAKSQAKKESKRLEEMKELAKGYDRVIVIDSIPYAIKLKQRPQHLADEFAKLGYFVIYLEPNVPGLNIRKVSKNLVTISDYKYLRTLKQKQKYFLLPNTMALELDHLRDIRSWGYELIYDYIDEFHEDISGDLALQLEVFNHLEEIKPRLAVVTATRLEEHLKKELMDLCPVIMAANAVNVDHFNYQKQDDTVPADLVKVKNTNHPIVGFYGALAPWIDFRLINRVAKNHPEWEIVLIGMDYNGALADLKPAANIHHYDSKQYSELASYAKHFDCAIIPFRLGEIAKSTSPVKLFEYMAAGLPTVGTRDLLECRGYDYIYLAEDYDDFETKLEQAIKDHKNSAARKRLLEQAEENTWAKRAATIDAKLRELER